MKMSSEEIACLSEDEKIQGVDKDWEALAGCFVPLEKGGASDAAGGWLPNYYVPTPYYINWAKGAIEDMRRNPGFAWKNERYFFKAGLTFSISGIYAPTFRLNSAGVFEAKGSGIFCDSIDNKILLSFFCSRFGRYQFKCYIKHSVDTSGDNINEFRFPTSNTETSSRLGILVENIIEHQQSDPTYPYHDHEQKEIDEIVYNLYGLTEEDIREVDLWYCRRYPKLAEAQGVLDEVREKYAHHLARCQRILEKPPSYWRSNPILQLIAEGESHTLELKETLEYDVRQNRGNRDVLKASLKTITGFLNSEGGTLLVGVSDSGEVKGIDRDIRIISRGNRDRFEQKIRNALAGRFAPSPTGRVNISFEELTEGTVCQIDVESSEEIIHLDDEVYVRDGNRTNKLEGRALTDWIRQRTTRQE